MGYIIWWQTHLVASITTNYILFNIYLFILNQCKISYLFFTSGDSFEEEINQWNLFFPFQSASLKMLRKST